MILTPPKWLTTRSPRRCGGFMTHPWCCCGAGEEGCGANEAKITFASVNPCTDCLVDVLKFTDHVTISGITWTLAWNSGTSLWEYSDTVSTSVRARVYDTSGCTGSVIDDVTYTSLTITLNTSGSVSLGYGSGGVVFANVTMGSLPDTQPPVAGGLTCEAALNGYSHNTATVTVTCAEHT